MFIISFLSGINEIVADKWNLFSLTYKKGSIYRFRHNKGLFAPWKLVYDPPVKTN